jgi:cytoskeletal protein CcmA (bactofilin family)
MAGSSNKNDFLVNTIIGPNTSVIGDIVSGGFTRIDGSLRGDLTVHGRVIIGERARMKSNISGTAVTIGGVVFGNVLASERIIILSSALVIGDIITRRIQADDGCLIHGKVVVCTDEEKWDQAVSEYRDAQGFRSALAARMTRPEDFGREAPANTPEITSPATAVGEPAAGPPEAIIAGPANTAEEAPSGDQPPRAEPSGFSWYGERNHG